MDRVIWKREYAKKGSNHWAKRNAVMSREKGKMG